EENSKRLLSSYLIEISSEISTEVSSEQTSEYVISEATSEENIWLDASDFSINVSTDMVIGVLSIPSISLNMPVIDTTTDELLTVSVCRYNTTNIGEDGNIVICGHNYIDGSHFGRLSSLNIDDEVILSDRTGKTYAYTIYETEMILPTDVDKVEKYIGGKNLTMFTCDATGDRRYVVRCKEKVH
ncbi:MAG: sortase, partial [Firmicutes bacterium]|nr:sortase [Bacillota bacterium]